MSTPPSPSATQPQAVEAPSTVSPQVCLAELRARFPALFAAPGVLPVKLRIHADIQARAPGVFSRRSLGAVLARYTTSTAYLKALVKSPQRFDLDGQPAGDIAPEHRQAAQEELAKRLHRSAKPPAKRSPQAPRPQRAPHAPRAAGHSKAHPASGQEAPQTDHAVLELARAYQSSALSKANFCTLKGVSQAQLEAALSEVLLRTGRKDGPT